MNVVLMMRRHRKRSVLIAVSFLLGIPPVAHADEDLSLVELRWHSTAAAQQTRNTGLTDEVPLTSSQTISVNAAMAHSIDSPVSAVFYGIGYLQRTVQSESGFRLSDRSSSSTRHTPDNIPDHAITGAYVGFQVELPDEQRSVTSLVVQRVETLGGANPTHDESWTVDTLWQRPGWFGMQYELGLLSTAGGATDDTEVLPVLGVSWHDERRGFTARFPDGLQAWHSFGGRFRVELSIALSGYHIRTAGANETLQTITKIDRTDIEASIGYRLPSGWEISFGAGLPLRHYVVESGEERTSYARYDDLDLMLRLRYRLDGGTP